MKIEIRNCNNIKFADINIVENNLNIKYAMNGTGKSTIGNALVYSMENKIDLLTPFGEENKPEVVVDSELSNIVIFNSDFVNNIVFKGSNVIENAFEVFIKSDKYDEKRNNIDNILKNLTLELFKNENLKQLLNDINAIMNTISYDCKTNKIAKRGTFKSIMQKENMFNVPVELTKYTDFLNDTNKNITWVDWKTKGFDYDDKGKCPFCADELKETYNTEKTKFTESYKKADVKNLTELINIIENFKNYIIEEKYNIVLNCIKNESDEAKINLIFTKFMAEIFYLMEALNKIHEFDSYRVKREEISTLSEKVNTLKIDLTGLEYFNNEIVQQIVNDINTKIDNILLKIEELKREIGDINGFINTVIDKSQEEINSFLKMAGFNYKFIIALEGDEKQSKTVLEYINNEGNTIDVDNISEHLSWGEKNAFALVLFMYYALSKKADLIILDDPISSFDGNKKYAIMHRLFENRSDKHSFLNKTVLMLTHDFEPIIDFGKNEKPNGNANMSYLKNVNGNIIERNINANSDVTSVIEVYYRNSVNTNINIISRINFLRRYIEHTNVKYTEEQDMAYQILSSLVHNKELKIKQDRETYRDMTEEEKQAGINYINNFIQDFDYNDINKNVLNKDNILNMYKSEQNNYIKTQIFRVYLAVTDKRRTLDEVMLKFIDEIYHIENDYIFSLDLISFDMIPEFIISKINEFMSKEE